MLQNWLCSFGAKYIRTKLNGHSTKIAVICAALLVIVSFLGKVFQLDMPGSDQEYSKLIDDVITIIQVLTAGGAATLGPVGFVMKGYKAGLMSIPITGKELTESMTQQKTPAIQEQIGQTQDSTTTNQINPGPPVGSGGFGPNAS